MSWNEQEWYRQVRTSLESALASVRNATWLPNANTKLARTYFGILEAQGNSTDPEPADSERVVLTAQSAQSLADIKDVFGTLQQTYATLTAMGLRDIPEPPSLSMSDARPEDSKFIPDHLPRPPGG